MTKFFNLLIFCFVFLSIFVLHSRCDKEELPREKPQHTERSTFEQKHMGGGEHDPEMDHKAILG